MAEQQKRRIADRVAQASIAGMVSAVRDAIYRGNRERALIEVAREVGAKLQTIEAIAERKAYDQIGQTEISTFLQTQFVGQPVQNLQTLAELYETHPWVKICASYIAGALSGMPLRIWKAVGYEDGKEVLEAADDSPVGKMFRWINPQQSPSEFVEDLASWLLLTGEAYVAFVQPGQGTPRGIPAEMFVMLTPFVEKIVSPTMGVVFYRYRVGAEEAIFEAKDVAYFKTFSPAGRFRGQAPAIAGYETIAADREMRNFSRQVFRQGVHLSGTLSTDNEDLTSEDAKTVRESFEAQYSGSTKAARVAVLWGGLKFNPTTILQKDVLLDEQKSANRDEIIALFGLKPELLTDKFANKATAETVRRMAYEDTILGRWGRKIESVLSASGLMQFDPDLRARFDTRDVPALQTSQTERVDVATKSVAGGLMTPNEARSDVLSLPPSDMDEADVLAFNGVPLSSMATQTGTATAGGKKFSVISFKAPASMDEFERLREASDARTERAIRSVLRDLQMETRSAIASRSTVNVELLTRIEHIFLIEGRGEIVKATTASIRTTIDAAVEMELSRMIGAGLVGVFDVKPMRALARLGAQEQRILNMAGKNWIDLRGQLAEGLSGGETTAELSARTSKFFDGMRNNAASIARTEINPALNCATQDVAIAAVKAGADVVSIWRTMGDELVRTPPRSAFDHARANGLTIVPGREIFVVSGEKMEYPGDSWNGASAANTINCRCGIRNEIRKPNSSDNRGDLR
jgi:HK97 family phage portal protein